jgi:hypothetical protein
MTGNLVGYTLDPSCTCATHRTPKFGVGDANAALQHLFQAYFKPYNAVVIDSEAF